MKNQEWDIVILGKSNDAYMSLEQKMFAVRRVNDQITVTAYDVDSRSGDPVVDTRDYSARFQAEYQKPDNMFLEIRHCWYKYNYIKEGFSCVFYRIPVQLNGPVVNGDFSGFDFLITEATDTFGVSINSKSHRESTCAIRAETYDGKQYFYTSDSQHFTTVSTFRCFDTADQAIKAGYKKSAQ